MSAAATKQYWFPVIPFADIILALAGWGITVSHEQLVKPTPDFVTGIYTACLEQVTSISHEHLYEPLQSALATLEDPNHDLFASSLAHNLILHHLTRFAQAAKIPDFNARDLSFPETERNRAILSAFVNFIKFAEQCAPFVTGLQERSKDVIVERDRVSRELMDIKHENSELNAERAQDQPRCEELQKENLTITHHLIATRDVQTALVKDIEALKIEKATVLHNKDNLNKDTALATDAISRTRSRIVQSPERIKRTISAMGSTVTEDKKMVVMNEAKARDLQVKINALLNIEKDVRSCVEQLQTIEKEISSLETSQKELAHLKDHLHEKKIDRSELQMKQERVHTQLSNAIEKLERAQRHAEDKRVASVQNINRLQKEYEEMALERRQNDKEVEELKADADEVAAKMTEHAKKSEAELNDLLAEYWNLRHQTEVYMETLANKLGMQVSAG